MQNAKTENATTKRTTVNVDDDEDDEDDNENGRDSLGNAQWNQLT